MQCIFCHKLEKHDVLTETHNFQVVLDIDPMQKGHLLIISKQHYMDIREIPNDLLVELIDLEKDIISFFETNFPVDGVTIIQNNGKLMDEGTHFHVHVVPRYKDDQFWAHEAVKNDAISISRLKEQLKSLNEIG